MNNEKTTTVETTSSVNETETTMTGAEQYVKLILGI